MRWRGGGRSGGLTWLLFPPRPIAVAVAVAATAWAIRRDRWRSPVFLIGTLTVALAVPHGLVTWHTDGMEVMRHLVTPSSSSTSACCS
jgi:hypothetical protein